MELQYIIWTFKKRRELRETERAHLSGYNNREFDLAMQFDIRRYVDVLADSVSDPRRTSENREPEPARHSKLRDTAANALAPAEEEWGKW